MPPQVRIGDRAMITADSHGCPACPHVAVGPAIQGSPNVLVNGLPAVRVSDFGIHTACCGTNTWNAKTGSKSVVINGKSAHRLSDLVAHCGGIGISIEGSDNVIVGDQTSARISQDVKRKHWINVQAVDVDGQPIPKANLLVEFDGGGEMTEKTDEQGTLIYRALLPSTVKISHRPKLAR